MKHLMEPTLPGTFRLDRSRSASIQAYEHLRDQIVSLAIPPGTVLPRAELSDYFGLSATPIRDALMRLEEEGLVDIFPQHVTRVSSIDLGAARQAHFVRMALELEIAYQCAQQPDPALAQTLTALVARQRDSLAAGDLHQFVRADMEFHRTMYHALGLDDVWLNMRSQSGNLDRLRKKHLPLASKAESILEEHTVLAQCIAAGDPDGARDCVREHLSGTLHILTALRAKNLKDVLPDNYSPEAYEVNFPPRGPLSTGR
jgi:DNA-binding GntR family transcriptional regulator